MAASNDYNFDHPGAFDLELLVATLRRLKQGKSVKIPVYDFTTHGRQKDWVSRPVSTENTRTGRPVFALDGFFKAEKCSYINKTLSFQTAAAFNAVSFFFSSLGSVQKNVYGASVIIFEGIMSFADQELLQVRPCVCVLVPFSLQIE